MLLRPTLEVPWVYVILKGLPSDRNVLRGTHYLNTNPTIVQFGLAKVSFKTLFKSGFKTSVLFYGTATAAEIIWMLLKDGELKTSYFSQIGVDISKLVIVSAVGAAAAGVVAAVGIPVAAGAGIVLVISVFTSVGLEFLDQQIGLADKFNDAAGKMLKSLEEHLGDPGKDQREITNWEPPNEAIFDVPLACKKQVLKNGNYLIYTA